MTQMKLCLPSVTRTIQTAKTKQKEQQSNTERRGQELTDDAVKATEKE